MSVTALRDIIGSSIVFSHFAAIFCIVLLFSDIELSRRLEVALIVSPLFFVFTMAIVKSVIARRHDLGSEKGKPLNRQFAVLAIFVTWCFLLFLWAVLAMFATGRIVSPEDLKTALSICETSFGVFLGLIIDTLFGGDRDDVSHSA